MDYRCDVEWFRVSTQYYQLRNPNFSKAEIEKEILIY